MKLHRTTTKFNCGIDLHAQNMYACIMDQTGKKLLHQNIKGNDFEYFLKLAGPYIHDLTLACESTFNWYWLADACTDAGIKFVLGHALYMKAIHGTKTKNDRVDSEKIAHLLNSQGQGSFLGYLPFADQSTEVQNQPSCLPELLL